MSNFEHIIGVRESATKPDTSTAAETVKANSVNSCPVRPVMNTSGVNTAASVMVMAMTAKPISLLPCNAALVGRHALLDVAVDVLQHDDCIVDHEAHGEHDPEHRQHVDREAQHVDEEKRADQRYGNGDRRNQRGAQAPEEQENHQHHQDQASTSVR